MKQYSNAIADYSKVVEMEPENVLAYVNRGLAMSNAMLLEESLKDYNIVSSIIKVVTNFNFRRYKWIQII
jgi:hypothetical protein